MKHFIIAAALLCSTAQVFAHSSGNTGSHGCHKHQDQKIAHCH